MRESLKKEVCYANLELAKRSLAMLTWGNVSAIDRESGHVVIKPSGVPYDDMMPGDMVVINLDGEVIEGNLRPSSDTPTHIRLYREWGDISAIVHTHSPWATSWAQARRDIPVVGTTHADTFFGSIPCTPPLSEAETAEAYESNTGAVIARTFQERGIDPLSMPGVLVAGHGPFTWGKNPLQAVDNAQILEEIAKMALRTYQISHDAVLLEPYIQERHYRRKHGPDAYYGQRQEVSHCFPKL